MKLFLIRQFDPETNKQQFQGGLFASTCMSMIISKLFFFSFLDYIVKVFQYL